MNTTSKPQIFKYLDYRTYLADTYAYYKQTTTYFSYRYFSSKAGINSSSFLKLVIEGKRGLTDETCEKFIHALRLWGKEGDFFRVLVKYNQAKTPQEKLRNFKDLENMKAELASGAESINAESPAKARQDEFWQDWMEIARVRLGIESNDANAILNAVKGEIEGANLEMN